jgi:uncharacterized membrane protein
LTESIALWLNSHGFSTEAIIFILSMIPITELRGAILLTAVKGFQLVWWKAFLIATLGNLVPIIPILLFLEPASKFLRAKSKLMDRFFDWLFRRTRRKGESIQKYGALGLMLFVAVPLPGTGAWAGCAAAFVFGIRFKYALLAISAGVTIAGLAVTAFTYGLSTFLGWLL